MLYVATVNIPGYLPEDDDPPVFNTPVEAWEYLIEKRKAFKEIEDIEPDWDACMQDMAAMEGPGTVYGSTPGYDDAHDLGLAYCVTLAE